jgi:hypothetical protein
MKNAVRREAEEGWGHVDELTGLPHRAMIPDNIQKQLRIETTEAATTARAPAQSSTGVRRSVVGPRTHQKASPRPKHQARVPGAPTSAARRVKGQDDQAASEG